jgi:VanZ family protein
LCSLYCRDSFLDRLYFFGFLCLISPADLPSGLFDWWDKAQHVFAFFCLSSLGILAYQKAVVKLAIGLLLYGALIEVLQWITGWRSGQLADRVADGIGIVIGYSLINKLIQKDR